MGDKSVKLKASNSDWLPDIQISDAAKNDIKASAPEHTPEQLSKYLQALNFQASYAFVNRKSLAQDPTHTQQVNAANKIAKHIADLLEILESADQGGIRPVLQEKLHFNGSDVALLNSIIKPLKQLEDAAIDSIPTLKQHQKQYGTQRRNSWISTLATFVAEDYFRIFKHPPALNQSFESETCYVKSVRACLSAIPFDTTNLFPHLKSGLSQANMQSFDS